MTKKSGDQATILARGIESFLADDRFGRRNVRWLAELAGINYSTLKKKLAQRPGDLTADELFAIADVFGVELLDIHAAGVEATKALAA